jgi:WD40-like Beta Propeller Repeat
MKSRMLSFLGPAALMLLLAGSTAYATFPAQNGRIVFVSDRYGSWQLYTIDPDGSDIAQVTNLPPVDYDLWAPSFSPDGRPDPVHLRSRRLRTAIRNPTSTSSTQMGLG